MIRTTACVVATALLAGCAGQPAPPGTGTPPADRERQRPEAITLPAHRTLTGERIAHVALNMVGAPYRYGGTSPQGFDCSGLVYFAYDHVGMSVPRTAAAQRRAARPVRREALAPGDLLFFDTRWKAGHVGIYVGDGRFVHAPSSGKRVTVAPLDHGYFAGRLELAARLH